MANYYDVLELTRDAGPDQIRSAYRRQAMRWHPDKNFGNSNAEEKFKQISEAYAVLSDSRAKYAYDRALDGGQAEATFHSQRIDPEAAAAMFLNEMMQLAYELTMQNIPWTRIAEALKQRGCPDRVANTIARGVEGHRKTKVRKSAARAFLWASGAIILGLIITAISFNTAAPGGRFLVTTGLFLYGAVNLCRAVYFLISGRVPKEKR